MAVIRFIGRPRIFPLVRFRNKSTVVFVADQGDITKNSNEKEVYGKKKKSSANFTNYF